MRGLEGQWTICTRAHFSSQLSKAPAELSHGHMHCGLEDWAGWRLATPDEESGISCGMAHS